VLPAHHPLGLDLKPARIYKLLVQPGAVAARPACGLPHLGGSSSLLEAWLQWLSTR
jgi:hypothetical protein